MSQRYRIIIPDEVFAELDEIHDYVKRDSPQNAEKLIGRLVDELYSLQFMPDRCPRVETRRRPGEVYRKLVSRPYLIYFRIDAATHAVYIVTIRHGAREPL